MADRSFNPSKLTASEIHALKPKARTVNQVSIRVAGRRFDLPIRVELLTAKDAGEFSYLCVPQSMHVLLDGSNVVSEQKRSEALSLLKKAGLKKKAPKVRAAPSLPPDVLAAISKAIPQGYKLGVDANGQPRLVKARPARKSN
jgi:hypothetical protein